MITIMEEKKVAKVRIMNPEEVSKDCLKRIGWMASVSTNFDKEEHYERVAKKCIEDGHKVPTYGFLFLLEISEISRVNSHELVRHEQGFYKVQRSQRYVKEDGFGYTVPDSIKGKEFAVKMTDSDELLMTFDEMIALTQRFYNAMLDFGIKAEDARYVLTNATHTKLHVAVNFEALRRFGNMRLCTLAQPEMRELAWEIKKAITEINPYFGDKIVSTCEELGYCVDSRCCGYAEPKKRIEELVEKGRMYEQLI